MNQARKHPAAPGEDFDLIRFDVRADQDAIAETVRRNRRASDRGGNPDLDPAYAVGRGVLYGLLLLTLAAVVIRSCAHG